MESVQLIADLYRKLIRILADRPDQITLEVVTGPAGLIFRVSADAEDIGKLIGKQGRNAVALRTILSAIGQKERLKIALEINDGRH